MKRSFLNNIAILVTLITISSCKARKEATAAAASPAPATTQATATTPPAASAGFTKKISSSAFNYNTLSLKAKGELSFNDNSNNVSMSIRMQKDKAIWVSITAIAGIEVARALITPDSIKVINRLEGVYLAKPFNYVNRFTNRQLSFRALEALLVGNPLPGTINENSTFETAGNTLRMKGDIGNLAYLFSFNTDNKLIQDNLKDSRTGQSLQASYRNFQDISDMKLPAEVQLMSDAGNKTVSLSLKYSSVSVNEPLELPFSIPKKFTAAD